MKKIFLLCIAEFVFSGFFATAQEVLPQSGLPELYRVVEKHNFRKRENGKYQGAAYRELRGTLKRESGLDYAGRFYILEETKRAAQLVAAQIEESVPVRLGLGKLGAVKAGNPGRFPTMRDFPAVPQEAIKEGTIWQAPAERILDPMFSGVITPVPVHVEYQYVGPGEYKGFPGHYLKAKYAVRYRRGQGGDPELDEVSGSHEANIFLPYGKDGPWMVSEIFRELYRWRGGRELSLEGTILTVFEGVSPLERTETAQRIAEVLQKPELLVPAGPGETPQPVLPATPPVSAPAGPKKPPGAEIPARPSFVETPLPGIELRESGEGVALTLNNLNFKPDSAELLASEVPRLDELAKALLSLPGRTFLVAGHAAATGRPEGEKQLSLERARSIAEALQKRGVPADKLLYEGRGSSQPVAPNTDAAGRERNRRVEIIILD
ncbi:MAG: OmpA family protein [Spirochaetaceae bacterium]|nr:OmpA family protein [Spirochaetaceae bacterium]